MNSNLKVLKYLLTGLTIVALIALIFLFFFPYLLLPHKVPKAETFNSGTIIDHNLITVGNTEDTLTKKITVSELASFFKKPIQPEPVIVFKEVPQEPVSLPVYNKKRLEYLGFADQESKKVYLFKDTLYNDVIRITGNISREGFDLISMDEEAFIISKNEELFLVKR